MKQEMSLLAKLCMHCLTVLYAHLVFFYCFQTFILLLFPNFQSIKKGYGCCLTFKPHFSIQAWGANPFARVGPCFAGLGPCYPFAILSRFSAQITFFPTLRVNMSFPFLTVSNLDSLTQRHTCSIGSIFRSVDLPFKWETFFPVWDHVWLNYGTVELAGTHPTNHGGRDGRY